MILGFDIDGTFGHYYGGQGNGLRDYCGTKFGIPTEELMTSYPTPSSYNLWECGWKNMTSFEEFWALHLEAVRDGIFAKMDVYDHAVEVMHRLKDAGHTIVMVTARDLGEELAEKVLEDTMTFFTRHNIPFDELVITNVKTGVVADLFVDDAPHNVEQLRAVGRDVVTFDQSYNRHLDGMRASNWLELEEIINDLEAARQDMLAPVRHLSVA